MKHVSKVRLLYKTILRLHRGLPSALKVLGKISLILNSQTM